MKKLKIWVIVMGIFGVIGLTSFIIKGTGEAIDVAHKEFGAQAALSKYEWFIDTSAILDKMASDIGIYTEKQKMCETVRDRLAREQCMLWSQEIAGIKSTYNDTVAEYNSASKKFNWELFNTNDLKPIYQTK